VGIVGIVASFFCRTVQKSSSCAAKQEGGGFFDDHVMTLLGAAEYKTLPAADDLIGC
jgi:hypothetical protein